MSMLVFWGVCFGLAQLESGDVMKFTSKMVILYSYIAPSLISFSTRPWFWVQKSTKQVRLQVGESPEMVGELLCDLIEVDPWDEFCIFTYMNCWFLWFSCIGEYTYGNRGSYVMSGWCIPRKRNSWNLSGMVMNKLGCNIYRRIALGMYQSWVIVLKYVVDLYYWHPNRFSSILTMGTQNHEIWKFYTPNIWVITPKNEGFGFPWYELWTSQPPGALWLRILPWVVVFTAGLSKVMAPLGPMEGRLRKKTARFVGFFVGCRKTTTWWLWKTSNSCSEIELMVEFYMLNFTGVAGLLMVEIVESYTLYTSLCFSPLD